MRNVFRIFLLISFLYLVVSCKDSKSESGSVLKEYAIKDARIDSIIRSVIKWKDASNSNKSKYMAMQINTLTNDTLDLVFSLYDDSCEISDKLLYLKNCRIIGYAEIEETTFVILTNISDYFELRTLVPFMSSTDRTRRFEYIYYHTTNCLDANFIYDAHYIHYKYHNGNVSKPYVMLR